eukprot:5784188-Prymnesium_polylepis.1
MCIGRHFVCCLVVLGALFLSPLFSCTLRSRTRISYRDPDVAVARGHAAPVRYVRFQPTPQSHAVPMASEGLSAQGRTRGATRRAAARPAVWARHALDATTSGGARADGATAAAAANLAAARVLSRGLTP